MTHAFVLTHDEARRRAVRAVVEAPAGFEVRIAEPRRNARQNALFHALLQEIAARVKWAGELRDVETWKRLVTAAWLRAEGESIQLLPSIDGKGLDVVYTPTSTLTKAQMASLVDFVTAWSVEQGIDMSEAA